MNTTDVSIVDPLVIEKEEGTRFSENTKKCRQLLNDDFSELEGPVKDEYLIDLSRDYPKPDYILKIDGVPTMPRGDISSTKAKSKNGKSFLESIFVAGLLGYQEMNMISLVEHPRAIYFDTEQNPRNTARIAQRVHTLLKWDITCNHDGFMAYSLRSMDTNDRLPYIQKIINQNKPDLVVIDGIADLINDFNNIEQSSIIIDEVMKISTAYNCHVSCVLHTNKAVSDNNMKGHIGTLLLQKSSDVYEVKKEGLTFNVSETDSRNLPIEDFSFCLNEFGIPIKTESIKENKELGKIAKIKNVFDQVFHDNSELSYKELCEQYALYSGESEVTAKRKIRHAVENKLLKVYDKKYSINI